MCSDNGSAHPPFLLAYQCFPLVEQATMFEEDEDSADGGGPCGVGSWTMGATASQPLAADYSVGFDQKAEQRNSRRHRKKKSSSLRRSTNPTTFEQQQNQQQHQRPLAIATGYDALQDMDGRRVVITPSKKRSQQVMQRHQLGLDHSPPSSSALSFENHNVGCGKSNSASASEKLSASSAQ